MKRTLLLLTLILSLLMVVPATAIVNMFDTNFASGYENGTFVPSLFKNGHETHSVSSTISRNGTHSLNVTFSNGTDMYEGFNTPVVIGVTPGGTYTFSFYARNITRPASFTPNIYDYFPNGTFSGATYGSVTVLNESWNQIRISRTICATCNKIQLLVSYYGAIKEGSVYVDDLMLESGSTAHEWVPTYDFTSNTTRGVKPLSVQFNYTGPVM